MIGLNINCPRCGKKNIKELSYPDFRKIRKILISEKYSWFNDDLSYKDILMFVCSNCGWFEYIQIQPVKDDWNNDMWNEIHEALAKG